MKEEGKEELWGLKGGRRKEKGEEYVSPGWGSSMREKHHKTWIFYCYMENMIIHSSEQVLSQ